MAGTGSGPSPLPTFSSSSLQGEGSLKAYGSGRVIDR